MPMAVLKNGEIRPLEPLPPDWREGQRLRIETADDGEATLDEIDRDFAQLASLCADSDPADEQRLSQVLQDAHEQAKEQVRRQNGASLMATYLLDCNHLCRRCARCPSYTIEFIRIA